MKSSYRQLLDSWRPLLLTWAMWSVFGVLCMNFTGWMDTKPDIPSVSLLPVAHLPLATGNVGQCAVVIDDTLTWGDCQQSALAGYGNRIDYASSAITMAVTHSGSGTITSAHAISSAPLLDSQLASQR